jgi:ribosome-binding factor A
MSRRQSGDEPSQRQLRVAEQIRHLLAADLLAGVVHDPRVDGAVVTVGEVRVSRDLKHAMVFATELGGQLSVTTQAGLTAAASFLAGRLARRMNLKYAPRLRFVADELFDEAARIERLMVEERRKLDADSGSQEQSGAAEGGAHG